MTDRATLEALVAAIPGAENGSTPDHLGFSVAGRGFAWTFMQRDHPKQKRWPNLDVLAISCPIERKEMLLEAAPDVFFDDPHYRGYPAILTRLPMIAADELDGMLRSAFAIQAAKPGKRPRR